MEEESTAKKIEEEVGRVVEQSKQLQEAAASYLSSSFSEDQSLRQRALSLDSSIKCCRSLLSSDLLQPRPADKLQEDLERARCLLLDGDDAAFLPTKLPGGFLKMFLGPDVRASRKDVQIYDCIVHLIV